MSEREEAAALIATLGLAAHPEGGWYSETWRAATSEDRRAAGSAIYYLLEAAGFSRWHRVDAVELWHHYAGDALELRMSVDGETAQVLRLGPAVVAGERPQALVPAGAWQSARSLGKWSLVGCTVTPAFEFGGFELAPEDWEPG